ncbi:MAG TPA: hypothetical protein VIQ24_10655, partial [Pyrinomonadaceae bacterium]
MATLCNRATPKWKRAAGVSLPARPDASRRTRAPTWQAMRPGYRLADCNYSRELEKTFMTNDNAPPHDAQAALLRLIGETLSRHGGDALPGDASPDAVARVWIEAGFADAEEVDDWLAARCFDARHARTLDAAGLMPEQAALR